MTNVPRKKYPVGKWPFVESLFNHYWLIYVSDFSISDGLSSTKASSTGIWPLITNRLGRVLISALVPCANDCSRVATLCRLSEFCYTNLSCDCWLLAGVLLPLTSISIWFHLSRHYIGYLFTGMCQNVADECPKLWPVKHSGFGRPKYASISLGILPTMVHFPAE